MRKIVIVGPAPVQILDVTGPLEAFSNAPGYEICLAVPERFRNEEVSGSIPLNSTIKAKQTRISPSPGVVLPGSSFPLALMSVQSKRLRRYGRRMAIPGSRCIRDTSGEIGEKSEAGRRHGLGGTGRGGSGADLYLGR